ncbi:hypothetical protein M9H77_33006 [Catharanthus roseus]|uniref:Uncharacterized protein n=1 Tax=Catharanthus roseus TaxID=4058 RepID=A0ACC0A5E0_CATRO|nr:hypothetical protein M9H77_33006 [Catharanthus roseus]
MNLRFYDTRESNSLTERQVKAGRAVTVARVFEDLKSGFLSSVPVSSCQLVDESSGDDIEFLEKTRVAGPSSKETTLKGTKNKRKRNIKRSSKNKGIEIQEPPELRRSSRKRKRNSEDVNNEDRSCAQKLNEEKDKGKTIANRRSSRRLQPSMKSTEPSYESSKSAEKKNKRKRRVQGSSKDKGIQIQEPPKQKRCTRGQIKDSKDGCKEDRSDQKQEKHKDIGPRHVEKVRGKAKVLNEEKDERRRSLRSSSRRHIPERDSNDGEDEMDCTDVEFMGVEHIPVEERMHSSKSRFVQRVLKTVVEQQTTVPSPGRDSNDGNKIQQIKKEIGDQGQVRVDIASSSRARIDSSRENDSPGDKNVENDETSDSISESSSEGYMSGLNDTDYEGDRSDSSLSDSDN